MENRKIPALIALACVVVAAVVLFAVGGSDTDDEPAASQQAGTVAAETGGGDGAGQPAKDKAKPPPKPKEPAVPQIETKGGAPVGGPLKLEVTEGDEIRIEVTTDTADELHLHTYDLYFDVVPGKVNEVVVENADIGGVIELESHTTGTVLAEISVVPG